MAAGSAPALDEALTCGADVLVLDVRESDAAAARRAREGARHWLERSCGLAPWPLLAVRIERVASESELADIMPGRPDGIVLRGCRSPADVEQLAARLAVHEAELGIEDGATAILGSIADCAAGLMGLMAAGYVGLPRLAGLTWDAARLAEDLRAEPASSSVSKPDSGPLALARTMTLVAARAAGILAIDTLEEPARPQSLPEHCRMIRRMGYSGKMVRHAAEVTIVNGAFAEA